MPFPSQTPKAFTRANVENLSPGQKGCYGLSRTDTWIYIGKGDIRDRLLAHLNGDNPCIARYAPSHFVTMVTDDMDSEEKSLILELGPACNQKVG
ncbi:MAG TPA: hypothetical protein VM238_21280 [Phycisphaerae bacterium]|nr:hypothetical protein [Phycisphaerae bacterium]